MKASIKFRDEQMQKPLLRAKIPLNILHFPFQSGVVAGDSNDLSLNLSTFFDSGPALKFSYRPNDSRKPFTLVFKSGIGSFGSPHKSPLTMTAEFNLIGNQNPSFFIHFKPDFGDFSLKKSHSSDFVKNFGDKFNNGTGTGTGTGTGGDPNFVNINGGYVKRNGGFLPVTTVESKAALNRLVQGTEMSAKTTVPLRDFAVLNFRWGLRFPAQDEVDAVVVGKRNDWAAGIRLPLLVMNKIGIEHVGKSNSKRSGAEETYENLGKMCTEVKKQLEVIQAENGLLSKALTDLRSDMAAAGNVDLSSSQNQRSKYSFAGGGGDKKCGEGIPSSGKEGNSGLKAAA